MIRVGKRKKELGFGFYELILRTLLLGSVSSYGLKYDVARGDCNRQLSVPTSADFPLPRHLALSSNSRLPSLIVRDLLSSTLKG